MPYCTNCGTEVGGGDSHCPNCGEEVGQRSKSRFGRVSGLGGEPLPRDTKNAFIGILVGILVFVGLQIGISYWAGVFDFVDDTGVAVTVSYVSNVILYTVVAAGSAFVLAKLNPLFGTASTGAGLSPQSKNAFLGVVVGNTVLTGFSYMGPGVARASLTSGSVFMIYLSSFVLFPVGVILCGYVVSKREVI